MPRGAGAAETKVSATQVIKWFESADPELAELVLTMATQARSLREAKRAQFAERMEKARAGRGKGKKAAAGSAGSASTTAPAEQAQPSSSRGPHVHSSAAPALNEEQRQAVSVEAD